MLVEANIGQGVVAAPLSKYARFHTRICRPTNLTPDDCERVCAYVIARPGETVPSIAQMGEFLREVGIAKFKWPERIEVVEGRAEVKQLFPGKGITIAGCIVREGRITRGAKARVIRGGTVVATDVVESLRRFRDDVREVKEGQECGIGLGPDITVQEGDILEVVGEQSSRRTL